MPNDNPGHDVRDENRNTENFAKGVADHAPEGTAQQGLETAGESSGITPEGETFYLNDKNGTGSGDGGIDGTTYLATDGPDIFVYDFSTANTTPTRNSVDTFEIYNFDSSEDTLIFTNTEVPLPGGVDRTGGEVKNPEDYEDAEIVPPFAAIQKYEIHVIAAATFEATIDWPAPLKRVQFD